VFTMIVGVGSAASFECDIFFVFLFSSRFAYSMAVASHICITLIIIKPHKQKTILRTYVVYASRPYAASFE
jgi:hypothetical protein